MVAGAFATHDGVARPVGNLKDGGLTVAIKNATAASAGRTAQAIRAAETNVGSTCAVETFDPAVAANVVAMGHRDGRRIGARVGAPVIEHARILGAIRRTLVDL